MEFNSGFKGLKCGLNVFVCLHNRKVRIDFIWNVGGISPHILNLGARPMEASGHFII